MTAVTVPSPNCLLIVSQAFSDRTSGTISAGSQLASWLISIPAGSTAGEAAEVFAQGQNLPPGTVAVLIDLSVSPPTVTGAQLQLSWVAD